MSWSNKYIGLPYADLGRSTNGVDCWGLAHRVYAMELGIPLPSYTGAYPSAVEQAEIATLIGKETDLQTWHPVDQPTAFDLLLFRHGRFSSHVGIQVDGSKMLHVASDDQSKIEDYSARRWSARFVCAFRHHTRFQRGL